MTIRSFLQCMEIGDHKSAERYPDGSGGKDKYMLTILMDGHGKALNAKIKSVNIHRGVLIITADGEKHESRNH